MDSARVTQQRDTVDRAADKDGTVLIASTGIVDSNEGVLRIKGCLGRDAVSQDLLGRGIIVLFVTPRLPTPRLLVLDRNSLPMRESTDSELFKL